MISGKGRCTLTTCIGRSVGAFFPSYHRVHEIFTFDSTIIFELRESTMYNVGKGASFNTVIKSHNESKKRSPTWWTGTHWNASVLKEVKGGMVLIFYDFAIKLRPYLSGGKKSDGAYVRSLFKNIVDDSSFDVHTDLFSGDNAISDDTWRSYIKDPSKSGRTIVNVAKRIYGKLDTDKFDTFIYDNVSSEKMNELGSVFAGTIPQCNEDGLPAELAKLFAEIIRQAATGRKKKAKKITPVVKSESNVLSPAFENEEAFLVSEVDSRCPITGKRLIKNTKNAVIKAYGIVYIYPKYMDLFTQQEFSSIDAPANIDSLDNKIALSLDEANKYTQAPTLEMYNRLDDIKYRLSLRKRLYECTGSLEIENNIDVILDNVRCLKGRPEGATDTKWDAFKVDDKIRDDYPLNNEVTNKVLQYYRYLEARFQENDGVDGFSFKRLKSTIHQCFIECEEAGMSQAEIFDYISNWVATKTGCYHAPTCRVFVSFFVQNCEVFDAITE